MHRIEQEQKIAAAIVKSAFGGSEHQQHTFETTTIKKNAITLHPLNFIRSNMVQNHNGESE